MSDDFIDDFDSDTPDEAPVAEGSVLAGLRERREQAKTKLVKDLAVPRMDPPVYVRFKPIPSRRLTAANKQAAASGDKDAEVIANAGVLAEACLGVFEVIDGREVSIDPNDRDGEHPKFDRRLAGLLGVPAGKASQVVRALYLTDGDIISTVNDLGIWSGFAREQMERDPEGN